MPTGCVGSSLASRPSRTDLWAYGESRVKQDPHAVILDSSWNPEGEKSENQDIKSLKVSLHSACASTHGSICSMSSAQNSWSSLLMMAASGSPEARAFAAATTPREAKPATPRVQEEEGAPAVIDPMRYMGPAMGHLGCRRDPAALRGETHPQGIGLPHIMLAGRLPIGAWEKSLCMVWLANSASPAGRRRLCLPSYETGHHMPSCAYRSMHALSEWPVSSLRMGWWQVDTGNQHHCNITARDYA